MASSNESQGLQIALIILFCLVVLLSVVTFTLFTKNEEHNAARLAAVEAAQKADAASRADIENLGKVVEWLGIEDPGLADVDRLTKLEEQRNEDMKKYQAALPEGRQNYHAATEELLNAKKTADEAREAVQKQLATLTDRVQKAEEAAQGQVKAAQESQKKSEADLAAEQAKFVDALKKKDEENKDLLVKLDTLQKKIAEDAEVATKQQEEAAVKIAGFEKQIALLKVKLDDINGNATLSSDDGEIRLVNQRSQTVWINLGRADNLRPQVSFLVHGEDSKAQKGKIEVTRILDDHLSEARIIEDSISNPLIPGDKILSALWDPGKSEHFVIAGRIRFGDRDLDGLSQLRSLIAIAGGVIDAELLEDGTMSGTMSTKSRYLILGEETQRSKANYDKLINDAKQIGVEPMTLGKFLDHIGWKSPTKPIVFGPGGNADQFAPERSIVAPQSTGRTTNLFQKRNAVPKAISAY